MKLKVKGAFFEIEVEGATAQEVWQQAAFWHSLPTICPVDETATRFGYSRQGDDEFYYLESTGTPTYQFHFGTRREDKKLFPGKIDEVTGKTAQRWTYWDGEKKMTVWQDGKLLAKPTVQRQPTTGVVELTEEQKATIERAQAGVIANVSVGGSMSASSVTIGSGRRTAMNVSGETCKECNAPAGRPHASNCSKHNG